MKKLLIVIIVVSVCLFGYSQIEPYVSSMSSSSSSALNNPSKIYFADFIFEDFQDTIRYQETIIKNDNNEIDVRYGNTGNLTIYGPNLDSSYIDFHAMWQNTADDLDFVTIRIAENEYMVMIHRQGSNVNYFDRFRLKVERFN